MTDTITVRWEAGDGYVGGSRPHTTTVYLDGLDEDATEFEILDFVSEAVHEDFLQKVSPDFDTNKVLQAVSAALASAQPKEKCP